MKTLDLRYRPCPVCGADDAQTVIARGRDYEYDTCDNELTMVRCEKCSAVFLNPRPALDDFDVIYPAHYYSTVEASSSGERVGRLIRAAWDFVERRRARSVLELLAPWQEGALLDVGCGDGRMLRVLRRELGDRWSLTGVELGLSDDARRKAVCDDIELIEGSYEDLLLARERFQLIVAQQVIEHTVEPGDVLAKMHAELAPNGHLLLDTPNFDGRDRRFFSGGLWGGYHFPRHLTLFTPETIARLANSRGFDVVQVRPMLSPVFWIMTLHNIAVRGGLPRALTARLTYRSAPLLALSTLIEVPSLLWSGDTSNMRVILRKRGEG